MNIKATVGFVLPTLALILSACDGGRSGPVDTSTKVTTLTDSGAGSLRQILTDAKAGDTIKFSTTGTVMLASPLTTSKNVTIDATGVTFDAAGKGRVLEIPAGVAVTLKGGTLKGGVGQVITANVASLSGRSGAMSLEGGSGVRMSAQAETETYGGIIVNNGALTLDSVTVTGGKADFGGGIANAKGATLGLTGTTKVTENTAAIQGGGIANKGSITITGGSVSGNTSYYSGAGIVGDIGSTLTMSSGNIDSNTCTYPVTVATDNSVSGCAGGGIYSNGDVTISGGSFSGNKVSYFGGGVTVQVTTDANKNPVIPKLTISGGTFENNKVTDETRGSGGASGAAAH
ncbi:hypothetical protein D3875_12780 [Deinococcus cavernae]|uniref:Right-handed parallel beta-helix repeat-containing protein n=1 Tax=Deinococcus cavernae TaxID=2320857 RepID=A0A418V877_9DEIO|nr:hypothetical protein [Deinococcus cavernae]RJF72294.1 hypothetical protein D3875_12780 [Deinococcus cavernae]